MTATAMSTDPMIAIVMLSTPESAGMIRGQVRAALEFHGLSGYVEDAELIASELVANAVRHARTSETDKVTVALIRVENPSGVAVIVVDSSKEPPVMREFNLDGEGGRGLRIVDALSARWDWRLEGEGKAIIAILANDELASLTRRCQRLLLAGERLKWHPRRSRGPVGVDVHNRVRSAVD